MLLMIDGGRSICISIVLDEHGDGAVDGDDDTLDDEFVLLE